MTIEEARALFSDYLEDTLDDATRDRLQTFLAQTPQAAADLIAFERTLSVVHRLPAREPSLDLWREFAPQMAAYQAERKLDLGTRLRQNWMRILSEMSTGMILWTHALADRTHARMERYLLHDPRSRFLHDRSRRAG